MELKKLTRKKVIIQISLLITKKEYNT